MCNTHVDKFLFGGTEILIKCVFTVGSKHFAAFKNLGLNISQSNSEIIEKGPNIVTRS